MSDPGTRKADATHAEIAKRLHTVYGAAARDIVDRLDKHQRRLIVEDAKRRQLVKAGKLDEKEYQAWLTDQVYRGKTWRDQVSDLTAAMLDANRQAARIINGQQIDVFVENANWTAYSLAMDTRAAVNWTLYDRAAVTRLIRNQPGLLPHKTVNAAKDTAWNRKTIAAEVTRGILSGASIPEIAENLGKALGSKNEKAMVRYARTAMTGAQNAGRMEMLEDAQRMGIRVKKTWLATLDAATREAHRSLDGQTQPIDRPFDSELGEIMYPGDPNADPANTWNCRCTLIYETEEYPLQDAMRYDQEHGMDIEDMDYEEWMEAYGEWM